MASVSTRVLSTPTLVINNQPVLIIPNSATYTEGFGEQQVKTQSGGGGTIRNVFIDNAESKFSTFKFSLFPTSDNIALARSWKSSGNTNAVSMTGQNENGAYFTRSFQHAALTNNYEVGLSADGKLDLEWASDASV
jgi:hypothetical protein